MSPNVVTAKRYKHIVFGLITIGLCLLLVVQEQRGVYATDQAVTTKTVLRFGILPDSDRSIIDSRFTPLLQYLQQETGIKIEYVPANNYLDLLALFKTAKVDVAWIGGYSYVQAHQQVNAKPLVLRDIDLKFSSVFLVRPENSKININEFRGSTISFGSRQSTSGHLMPRYFLYERHINPEQFFANVVYSGGHDKTAYAVRDKKADLGAANSMVIRKMLAEGLLKPDDVRIIWETPVYTDYVLVVQQTMPEEVQQLLIDAFLALSPLNQLNKPILDALGAKGFLPASNLDFVTLFEIAKLLDKDMQ
jgi:phosphonate transport system substrate-binding protein